MTRSEVGGCTWKEGRNGGRKALGHAKISPGKEAITKPKSGANWGLAFGRQNDDRKDATCIRGGRRAWEELALSTAEENLLLLPSEPGLKSVGWGRGRRVEKAV